MKIDWNVVFTAATAIAAFLAALFSFLQIRKSGLISSAELICELDDRYYKKMINERKKASRAILKRSKKNLDPVFNFFELVALLTNRNALDKEMVWNTFYEPIAYYWFGAKEYISSETEADSTYWEDLKILVPELLKIQRERKGKDKPSKKEILNFMTDESK